VARAIKASKTAGERERWPRDRLERWQRDRLNELARHAVENSRFWQARLGRLASDIKLKDLPVLDKATMMEHFDDLVTDRRLRRDALLEHLDGLDHDALYRLHEPARSFVERTRGRGKSYREALRCLKRHLARVVFKLLKAMALSTQRPRLSTSIPTVDLT
jgi:hypothetical protein